MTMEILEPQSEKGRWLLHVFVRVLIHFRDGTMSTDASDGYNRRLNEMKVTLIMSNQVRMVTGSSVIS